MACSSPGLSSTHTRLCTVATVPWSRAVSLKNCSTPSTAPSPAQHSMLDWGMQARIMPSTTQYMLGQTWPGWQRAWSWGRMRVLSRCTNRVSRTGEGWCRCSHWTNRGTVWKNLPRCYLQNQSLSLVLMCLLMISSSTSLFCSYRQCWCMHPLMLVLSPGLSCATLRQPIRCAQLAPPTTPSRSPPTIAHTTLTQNAHRMVMTSTTTIVRNTSGGLRGVRSPQPTVEPVAMAQYSAQEYQVGHSQLCSRSRLPTAQLLRSHSCPLWQYCPCSRQQLQSMAKNTLAASELTNHNHISIRSIRYPAYHTRCECSRWAICLSTTTRLYTRRQKSSFRQISWGLWAVRQASSTSTDRLLSQNYRRRYWGRMYSRRVRQLPRWQTAMLGLARTVSTHSTHRKNRFRLRPRGL